MNEDITFRSVDSNEAILLNGILTYFQSKFARGKIYDKGDLVEIADQMILDLNKVVEEGDNFQDEIQNSYHALSHERATAISVLNRQQANALQHIKDSFISSIKKHNAGSYHDNPTVSSVFNTVMSKQHWCSTESTLNLILYTNIKIREGNFDGLKEARTGLKFAVGLSIMFGLITPLIFR